MALLRHFVAYIADPAERQIGLTQKCFSIALKKSGCIVILSSAGAHHKLISLKSMYADCSVAVKIGGRVSPSLPSLTGLKQGCPLSPTLFSLFSDGLHRHLLHECPDNTLTYGYLIGARTRTFLVHRFRSKAADRSCCV